MATEQWFNQNWLVAASTFFGAIVGAVVLLRQAIGPKTKKADPAESAGRTSWKRVLDTPVLK